MGRSGSNLLEKMLWGHPDVNNLLPLERGPHVHDDRAILENLIPQKGLGLRYDLRWRLDDLTPWQPALAEAVNRVLVERMTTLVRTSALTPHALWMRDRWPQAKFVWLVRHPIATACSLARFLRVSDPAKVTWRAHEAYLRWLKSGGLSAVECDFIMIRYEDLCRKPEDTVRRVLQFLGLNARPEAWRRVMRYEIRPPQHYDYASAVPLVGKGTLAALRMATGY